MHNGKIFNIGMPKTGTSSLHAAFEILGISSCHNSFKARRDAFLGKYDLPSAASFQAFTNFGEHFYPELDGEFPDSRFILTTRNVEDWLISVKKQFSTGVSMTPNGSPPRYIKSHELWRFRTARRYYNDASCEIRRGLIRLEIFGCLEFNEAKFRRVYSEHHAHVLRYFEKAPERLLVMDIASGDGWEALCPFLDIEQPPQSFPYVKPEVSGR